MFQRKIMVVSKKKLLIKKYKFQVRVQYLWGGTKEHVFSVGFFAV